MPRPLTTDERSIIERLLTEPFPGHDELRAQLSNLVVVGLSCDCGCGSLALAVEPSAPAALAAPRVAGDGFGYDAAGQLVGILLFVDRGYMSSLEFYDLAAAESWGPPRPETVEVARWSEPDEHGRRFALNARSPHEHPQGQ